MAELTQHAAAVGAFEDAVVPGVGDIQPVFGRRQAGGEAQRQARLRVALSHTVQIGIGWRLLAFAQRGQCLVEIAGDTDQPLPLAAIGVEQHQGGPGFDSKRRQVSQSLSSRIGALTPCPRNCLSERCGMRSLSKRGTCTTITCSRPGLRACQCASSASRSAHHTELALTNASTSARPRCSCKVEGLALSQVGNSGSSWVSWAVMQ